jgi:hypothetical protein
MVSLIALLIVVLVIASVIASQIALEYYTDRAFWVWACIILVWVGGSYFAYSYDMGTLTPIAERMTLLDKWHEESCSPTYDDKGNYTGEACSDNWTLAVDVAGQGREEISVSGNVFKTFPVGSRVERSYLLGRLGFHHDEDWAIATQEEQ